MRRPVNRTFSPLLRWLAIPLLAFPLNAWAGPATDTVKAKQSELFKLLEVANPDQKKVTAIFDGMLDYNTLAEASLGSEWAPLTEAQRTEFRDLLKQLISRAYEKNLKKTLSFNIEYVGESETATKTFLVKTKAVHKTDKREEPIEINFKLIDKGQGFRVADIVTEGVSLVESYRAQFTKILKKDGFAALTGKMKEKIAKGE
jgi:phospholipid transport system substrate-binding protein